MKIKSWNWQTSLEPFSANNVNAVKALVFPLLTWLVIFKKLYRLKNIIAWTFCGIFLLLRRHSRNIKDYIHCKDTVSKKCETNIPRQKNCAASFPISTFMFLWAIYSTYSHDQPSYFAAENRRPIVGIWKSLTDWERGRRVSFLETHKSDLLCSVSYQILLYIVTHTQRI